MASSSSSSRGKKPGGIHTLSDLTRRSGGDSDSNDNIDSDGNPQEYYTGGEKSGMLVQDPSKFNDVDAIFSQARRLGAVEDPVDNTPPSSSSRFSGAGRLLSGEAAPSSPQEPQPIIHNIVFWTNGYTVNDGPLQRLDDPENASFLESIRKSECPRELEPEDRRSAVHVKLIRRDEACPEPENTGPVPFQGVARTLGGTGTEGPISIPVSGTGVSSLGPVVDPSLPSTSIQIRLADGTRMVTQVNYHHTVADLRGAISASRPNGPRNYQLQIMGFPPKSLNDPSQTIEEAKLANSVIIQKL